MNTPCRRLPALLSGLALTFALAPALPAQTIIQPDWWQARGVLNGLPTSDTALVTQQQVYNFALAAVLELDDKLSTPAGSDLTGAEELLGTPQPLAGLHAEYFDNRTLSGSPVIVRQETALDHDWGDASHPNPPGDGLYSRGFSARWTGEVIPAADGLYVLEVHNTGLNGQVQVWINGTEISTTERSVFPLSANQGATIQVEYRGPGWGATEDNGIQVRWGAVANGTGLSNISSVTYDSPGQTSENYDPSAWYTLFSGDISFDSGKVLLVGTTQGDGLVSDLWGDSDWWDSDPLPTLNWPALRIMDNFSDGTWLGFINNSGSGSYFLAAYDPSDLTAWGDMTPFGQTDSLGEWRAYENLALINGTVGRLRDFATKLRNLLQAHGYINLPTVPTGADSANLTVHDLKALFNFDLDNFDEDHNGLTFAEENALHVAHGVHTTTVSAATAGLTVFSPAP